MYRCAASYILLPRFPLYWMRRKILSFVNQGVRWECAGTAGKVGLAGQAARQMRWA